MPRTKSVHLTDAAFSAFTETYKKELATNPTKFINGLSRAFSKNEAPPRKRLKQLPCQLNPILRRYVVGFHAAEGPGADRVAVGDVPVVEPRADRPAGGFEHQAAARAEA